MKQQPAYLPCTSAYYLLEESRKSWDHITSDKIVYVFKPSEVALNSFTQIAKHYIEGRFWIESHLTFRGRRDTHYILTYEFDVRSKRSRKIREIKVAPVAVDGKPSVFIDNAKKIETPQEIALNGCGIPSLIRLKRFDDGNCSCGYSGGLLPKSPKRILILGDIDLHDGKLGSFGVGRRQFRQRPNQLIQGRSHTVQELTSDVVDSDGDFTNLKANQIPFVVSIVFGPNGLGFRLSESSKFLPQFVKVFLPPGSFGLGIGYGRPQFSAHARLSHASHGSKLDIAASR